MINPFNSKKVLKANKGNFVFFSLAALEKWAPAGLARLPVSIRILLENVLRHCDGRWVTPEHVSSLARWSPKNPGTLEVPFLPSRVILQDFTGVPCVADLAAMRSAVSRMKGDPKKINPVVPVDLVIDHSVQVDVFGSSGAFARNVEIEYERNQERYAFLRWAQKAFKNFSVVPPGTGIVHQVNLEYLAQVVQVRDVDSERQAFPDTLVGTDSHTTMINGLGVLGWGVGGIEAEACMLNQPLYMLPPEVVGFKLTGNLGEGATATDLVLTITQMLRKKGVVNKFVEFYGPGMALLPLPDRATVANMAPEYGATMGYFPVDEVTIRFLAATGRREAADTAERYFKEQGLFWNARSPEPDFSERMELDLSTVEPSLAGPRRPQDRVLLADVKKNFTDAWKSFFPTGKAPESARAVQAAGDGHSIEVADGSVVIAAITSCTNTSNPSVMMAAGILAKKAVERGLMVMPQVKTSLAPGSRVVTDYLQQAGLMKYLEALNFHLVGYGCTTCIGNSGPLPEPVSGAIKKENLVVVAVLSGNRNFEGRINPLVKASYLTSPPLVVAYALAGSVNVDLSRDPIGKDRSGGAVYLKDIWPTPKEIADAMNQAINDSTYSERYQEVFSGDERWRAIPVPEGDLYDWNERSTYIQEPPFFKNFSMTPGRLSDVSHARVLVMVGDSVTTDHISPAGSIQPESPAGKYLLAAGVAQKDFNSFGARRGNHEIMMRGTFGNLRLKNFLVPGVEGYWTKHLPSGDQMTIYDAAMRYRQEGVPLVVLAGQEYGSGSSRDWAAKGVQLLGVRVVIAQSYERIHRSNLVGMGVLPLEFLPGQTAVSLGLAGNETYFIEGLASGLKPRQELPIKVVKKDGATSTFKTRCRLDSSIEAQYLAHGGILPAVLRQEGSHLNILHFEERVAKKVIPQ
ncbi:MAG: aconitate hydratase AcnA [Elusimicrobia bacterium]|nr:aconitate hydratase AcnA [Elusimicrobiota bacterium]